MLPLRKRLQHQLNPYNIQEHLQRGMSNQTKPEGGEEGGEALLVPLFSLMGLLNHFFSHSGDDQP